MQKLAPELLAAIFDQFDDVADLCTVRILCGNFKEAAWPAFARSLNDRVFHLTPYSLKTLSDLANHKAVVPYVKRLQISTVKLHLDGDTSFSDWERTSGRWDWEPDLQRLANDTYDEVSEKDRKDMDRDEARALLKSLLQQLTVLTSLVIVDGGEYTRPIRLFKFPDRVNKRLDEIHRHRRLYDLHAHKDTLDLVAKALCSCKSKALCSTPCNRISKFKTVGSIDFADLSCSGLLSKLPLLKTTTLNLTMTPTTMQRLDGQRSGSLEELLEPIAPSLVSLTLTFPNYITSGSGHDTSDYIRPTLGLHFPRLHTIHIAYLQDQGAFNSFLKAHTSTLRTLRLKGYSTTQPRFDAFLDVLANHMRLTLFELRSGHTKQQALEVIASGRAWLQYDEKEIKRCADSVLLNTAGS